METRTEKEIKQRKLIIMRGLPGSGKSTRVEELVKSLTNFKICSNDYYPGYYDNGIYNWTPERAKYASMFCKEEFDIAIKNGESTIILDNTNLSKKSYGPYKAKAEAAGYEVIFETIEPEPDKLLIYAARNKHNVSIEVLMQMLRAWEKDA